MKKGLIISSALCIAMAFPLIEWSSGTNVNTSNLKAIILLYLGYFLLTGSRFLKDKVKSPV